jgi:cytochrome c oxidase subunit 1
VVAHFHYVVFGTVVFAMFAGIFFWYPKMTGKMLNERLGKIQFWLLFVGFHATFLIQHWLGVIGMPRRYATYLPEDGFAWMNLVSTAGSVFLALSMLPFFWNIYITYKRGVKTNLNDPWGYGRSLEWATESPFPRHNFTSMPRVRSESPAFDLNHPEYAAPEAKAAAKQKD